MGSPTSSENFVNFGLPTVRIRPEFSTNILKFCVVLRCQALHTANRIQPNFAKREEVNSAAASRIWWRGIVDVNETIEIRSLMPRAPKHSTLAMASCRAVLSRNASLIATFSSFGFLRFSYRFRYFTLINYSYSYSNNCSYNIIAIY